MPGKESEVVEIISPSKWQEMWAEIDPHVVGERMGLMAYAELVNKVKRGWLERWPGFERAFSNGRYAVYLEEALFKSLDVPNRFIATVKDDDLQYDGFCFPLLNQARAALKEPDASDPFATD